MLALVRDWPPYQAWYKRLIRSAAKRPAPKVFQAQALEALLMYDPAIRSALAVHNPDNQAYAVLALAHGSAVTPVARKETAV